MSQINADGLYIKFGLEEAASNKGGLIAEQVGPYFVTEVTVTSADITGSTQRVGASNGSQGVQFPRKAIIEKVEFFTRTAFTSSGTIGSATLVLGLIKDDFTTELDYDGIATASLTFTGCGFDTLSKSVTFNKASTGNGALLGVPLSNAGWLTISNSTNGSNPVAAGTGVIRIYWTIQDADTAEVGS